MYPAGQSGDGLTCLKIGTWKLLNILNKDNMINYEIELMGWIGEDMSEEEVIAYIDEIEAEEEARIELADMAREGWR
jgi:hypothetical protein